MTLIVGIGEILFDIFPNHRELGGAPFNFAFHANQLGYKGIGVTRIGKDENGKFAMEILKKNGMDTSFVQLDEKHATGTVDVLLDDEGKASYHFQPIGEAAWDHLTFDEGLTDLAKSTSAVCFGTLAQRDEITRKTILQFLKATSKDCIRVFDINLRQHYYSKEVIEESLLQTTILKLNDEEVGPLAETLQTPEDVLEKELFSRYPLKLIAITRGSKGASLISSTSTINHPGYPVTLKDTIGAGDAFTATLVAGLLKGLAKEDILAASNQIAAFVCTQSGAMPQHPPKLLEKHGY